MLILHAIEHLNTGGEERLLCGLVRELDKFSGSGLDQHVVILKGGEMLPALAASGVPCTNLAGMNPLHRLYALIRLLSDVQPDIIHTRLSSAGYWLRLAAVLSLSPAQCVHAHAGATFHKGRLKRRILEFLLRPATRLHICVSNSVKTHLLEHGFSSHNLVVLPNGIDVQSIPARNSRPFSPSPRLLCLGRLEPVKGQNVLLKALRLLRDQNVPFHCDFVGDGSRRQEWERFSRELRLEDQVRFLGNQLDFSQHLHEYDLFVQPSLSEGLSLALLEAMAARLPVVASDVGWSRHAAEENALFVEAGNPHALASGIAATLNDEKLALQRAAKGGLTVQKYGLDILAVRYKNVFEKALGRKMESA